jgi:hypothetical protein
MSKKKVLIIFSILAIFLVAISLAYYYSFVAPKEDIAERCQGFVPNWMDFIDCHGVVSINDGWDMDYLSLKDHVHEYEIARVYNQDQYLYVDGKVFVINLNPIEGSASDGLKTEYYQRLFQNGKLVENPYSAISDIPTYLVIDTQSGETQAYRTVDEVPQEYRQYFIRMAN